MSAQAKPVGDHIRSWRLRRRMSQMDLALEAEISTRHLSFLETGRSRPSRDMVLHLADRLDIPLRERNVLLTAAGFAAVYPERAFGDPDLAVARRGIEMILAGHEPYPALVVDLQWNLVAANGAVTFLLEGLDPSLLTPPVNMMRLALHPLGLASRTVNLAEWRAHALDRLRRQIDLTADPGVIALLEELMTYPEPPASDRRPQDLGGVAVPFQLLTDGQVLSFYGTTTVFGTASDITLAELTLETFVPADAVTSQALQGAHAARQGHSA